MLPDGTKADYALCDRHGRAMAVIEAKRSSTDPRTAERQAVHYARQLQVPFAFLSNGSEVWFWEYEREAHPHAVRTFFAQEDLERRIATLATRVDPLSIPIDTKIAGRGYQKECIEALCQAIAQGRRKLLVEMATGTGKTRTAAALIKRLFQANAVTRVLFLVDRITLAKQTEDVFAEQLRDYPAYVLRPGRRFQDEKRITITTLQSMVSVYRSYSAGYFDLVITDECHRSIYGKWSGVLKHFDGVQLGLTATPCVVSQAVLDKLPDKEDAAFVKDTLRFFEVDRSTGRSRSRRPPRAVSRSAATSSTGPPWTIRPRPSSSSCLPIARPSRSIRMRSSGASRSPSATGRWSRSSGRSWTRAILDRMASGARPWKARRSSSP